MKSSRWHRTLAWPAALGVLSCIVGFAFWPALEAGFTDWDDPAYLTENPLIRDLSWGAIGRIFRVFLSGNYHPLPLLTYAVEFSLGGMDARLFHATNLILHLLNTSLCVLFFRRLGSSRLASLLGALLFAVHPLRVEPVAWVTGRKDLLCTAFFLMASTAYVVYVKNGGWRMYAASVTAFVFAVLSKATAVSLPAVLLLCDYLLRRPMDRRAWLDKAPYLLVALATGVVAIEARESFQSVLREAAGGLWSSTLLAAHRIVFYYLVRTALPATTSFSPYPPAPSSDLWAAGLQPLALPLLALLVLLAVASSRRTSKLPFGAGFFLACLAPSLTISVVGYSADRFAYLGSIGLAYVAGETIACADKRLAERPYIRSCAWGLMVAVVAGLVLISRDRCAIWNDSVSLWTDAVSVYSSSGASPENLALAYTYRGRAHRDNGELEKGLADLDTATRIDPRSAEAYTELGLTRFILGDTRQAIADFTAAIIVRPEHAAAYTQRGIARQRVGDTGGAIADLTAAISLNPRDEAAYNERGIVLALSGRYAEATEDFTRAAELAPGSALPFFNRGNTHLSAGEYAEAESDFSHAIELDLTGAEAYYGRFLARQELGDAAGAAGDLARAAELGHPDATERYQFLRGGPSPGSR